MINRFPLVAALLFAVPTFVSAETLKAPLEAVPDDLKPFYIKNSDIINDDWAVATDGKQTSSKRLAAIKDVQQRFPHLSGLLAVELINDADPAIGMASATILSAQVVMMNHGNGFMHDHSGSADPVEVAIAALREGLQSGHEQVRDISGIALSSFGDVKSLELMASMYKGGKMDSAEAAKYLTLTAPQLGAPYVDDLLESGSKSAKLEAISYLGPLTSYRSQIRDGYLLNSNADADLRGAAARALALSDPDFAKYAVPLSKDVSVPPQVFENVVLGLAAVKSQGQNREQLNESWSAIQQYEKAHPGTDLSSVRSQIDRLQ